jgi:hypothetical protein
MAAAVLTRQSFLWLAPVAAFYLVRTPLPPRLRAAGAGLGALALAPMAALVVVWGGLVPPTADPLSCGFCADKPGVGRDSLTLRTVSFTIALFGVYATAVLGPGVARRAGGMGIARRAGGVLRGGRQLRAGARELAPPLLAAVALLAISPLAFKPVRPGQGGDAGYLWKISDRFPELFGTSLLFWALVPLGAVALFLLARREGPLSLPVVYFASFLVAALPVGLVYQKYFDPFALLAMALVVRPPDLRDRADYAGVAILAVAFVAYALSFAG